MKPVSFYNPFPISKGNNIGISGAWPSMAWHGNSALFFDAIRFEEQITTISILIHIPWSYRMNSGLILPDQNDVRTGTAKQKSVRKDMTSCIHYCFGAITRFFAARFDRWYGKSRWWTRVQALPSIWCHVNRPESTCHPFLRMRQMLLREPPGITTTIHHKNAGRGG